MLQKTALTRLVSAVCCLVLVMLALGGCSPYRLQGIVIDGPSPAVMVVDRIDDKYLSAGLGDVVIEVTIDPRSLGNRPLPPVISDSQGRFSVPVNEVGAGLLEYEFELSARAQRYQALTDRQPLPSRGKYLVVVLRAGADRSRQERDLLQETLEWKNLHLD